MDISIVVCGYNPEQRIFSRCLTSLSQLEVEKYNVELIIVDNNSGIPIAEQHYVNDALSAITFPWKVVTEPKQGLSFARVRGFKAALGELIVMFDDDNEPASNYVLEAIHIMQENQELGIVGPGKVSIDYLDPTPGWIRAQLGSYFQEKNIEEAGYTLQQEMWHPFYPPGTGQVIRRQVIDAYVKYFESGQVSATDRSGTSLASAGDSQIIWASLNAGFKVGHHPLLKVTHLIPGRRSNSVYLRRLSFALSTSGKVAFIEMYPQKKSQLIKYKWYKYFYHQLKTVYDSVTSNSVKTIPVKLGFLAGEYEAYFKVEKKQRPWFHKILVNRFFE